MEKDEKRCPVCKKEKKKSEFYIHFKNRTQSYCKKCCSEYSKKHEPLSKTETLAEYEKRKRYEIQVMELRFRCLGRDKIFFEENDKKLQNMRGKYSVKNGIR
jgi:hypothetical protein